jgi:hypothetical protein
VHEPNPARGQMAIGCGGLLRQPAVTASRPDWRGVARVLPVVTAWWPRTRRRPAGRPGVGEPAGIAHTRKGGGAGQGGTDGDAPRQRCDGGAAESAWDGGVPVGGGGGSGSGDLWGPRQLQRVNGGVRRGSHWSGVARMHGSPVKAEAAVSASKPTERGAVSDARETLRAVGATGQGVRVLGSGGGHGKERNGALVASNWRARGEGQEKENGWGVRGSAPRGGENRGGVRLGPRAGRRRGPARHEHSGFKLLRQQRATHASLEWGASAANRGGRRRARRGTARLTGGGGRATSGPGGSGRGAGESVSERGSATRGTDWRARQHNAAHFSFKPIQTESKIFQTVQTDSKFD